MGFEHEPETVWRAQELYCVDRMSFERVAQMTGLATSTLKRWADKLLWRQKREEIAQLQNTIRVNSIKVRASVLQKLLEAEDGKEASQMAFAVASLGNLALKQQELAASGKLTPPPPVTEQAPPPTMTNADMVDALRQAVQGRLSHMLSGPEGVNLAGVKEVLACLDLLARHAGPGDEATAATAAAPLSADNAAALREALGL